MNPTCTIKSSQVEKTRKRKTALKAVGAPTMDDGRPDCAANATAASKRAGGRHKKALEVARMTLMECPRKSLLEAARSGDADAVARATELFGKTWRKK